MPLTGVAPTGAWCLQDLLHSLRPSLTWPPDYPAAMAAVMDILAQVHTKEGLGRSFVQFRPNSPDLRESLGLLQQLSCSACVTYALPASVTTCRRLPQGMLACWASLQASSLITCLATGTGMLYTVGQDCVMHAKTHRHPACPFPA
jgi:hypothetical protein